MFVCCRCKQCEHTFSDSSSLYKHQRTHHQRHHEPTLLGINTQAISQVSQLPAGLRLAMGSVSATQTPVVSGTGVQGIQVSMEQPATVEQAGTETGLESAILDEETIYADLGATATDKTYICKMCQIAVPNLEACYAHQRVHGQQEVSFLVTVKQPRPGGETCPSYRRRACRHGKY